MSAEPIRGLLDTNILALRRWTPASCLPDEMAISAVTVAELAAGVHLVDGDDNASSQERARRVAVLQQTEPHATRQATRTSWNEGRYVSH